jgi:hypothetical protein
MSQMARTSEKYGCGTWVLNTCGQSSIYLRYIPVKKIPVRRIEHCSKYLEEKHGSDSKLRVPPSVRHETLK